MPYFSVLAVIRRHCRQLLTMIARLLLANRPLPQRICRNYSPRSQPAIWTIVAEKLPGSGEQSGDISDTSLLCHCRTISRQRYKQGKHDRHNACVLPWRTFCGIVTITPLQLTHCTVWNLERHYVTAILTTPTNDKLSGLLWPWCE